MNGQKHNEIVSFIWGIADDVLRDVFVRGKYRDIILPFTVIRRIDALLEPTKEEVLTAYEFLKDQGIDDYSGLTAQSGYPFYNISPFTMRDLLNNPDSIDSNLELYLDGFDPFVHKIISKFKIRNQLETLSEANLTFSLIEKFTSKRINLSPEPAQNDKGENIPGLTNLGMGYVFEELVRKFNEENNEEAGEHFTPRDIIELMTQVVFMPVKDQLKEGATYLVYDPACGTGGMLTESENLIKELFGERINTYLYGQEINPETYAICTADMLIKDEDPENIYYGSTLSDDGFPNTKFDFMLTNPPYGKSWGKDKKQIEKNGRIIDHRFVHGTPWVKDGQLLFLSNMVSKMKHDTKLGSRIASVHNGSALFTGNAGQGESDIRKWIIENDYLEAIIALPKKMFYNTDINTYVLVLCNKKNEKRKGKVQLIDATQMYSEMQRNLGDKSRELKKQHIKKIFEIYNGFESSNISKIFDNEDFGYQEITVERPLRLKAQLSDERIEKIRFAVTYIEEMMEWMYEKFGDEVYEDPKQFKKQFQKYMETNEIDLSSRYTKKLFSKKVWKEQRDLLELAKEIQSELGDKVYSDFNVLRKDVKEALEILNIKTTKSERKSIYDVVSWKDENAEPVISKINKDGTVVYEPDTELRDTENVPLKEDIEDYFERDVLPYISDAWIDISKTKVGYWVPFTKYFSKHPRLKPTSAILEELESYENEQRRLIESVENFSELVKDNSNGDWVKTKIKEFVREVSIKGYPDKEPLSVYRDYGVIKRSSRDDNINVLSENLSNHKYVKPNFLVINKMKTWQGSLGISPYEGLVSPSYITCEVDFQKIRPWFFHYLLRSHEMIAEYKKISYGVRPGQWDLNFDEFKNLTIYYPSSKDVQDKIVDSIRSSESKIDNIYTILEQNSKLIEELKKRVIADGVGHI